MLSSCTSKIQKLQNRVFSVLKVLYSHYKMVVLQRYSYGLGLWFRVRAYEKQNGKDKTRQDKTRHDKTRQHIP